MATNMRDRTPWSDQVAAQVRAERAVRGMTQAEVYDAAGMSRSTYIRIEKGTHVADVTELARICRVLGVPLSDLIARAEARMPH